ncbi:MAG TPA: SagB/ThcOx family dehydrogenase [Dehalococcoidia bacterium]|nr:SagB/ThcOx family dehydrogenase [Dehalococcoidia bacterium]
MANGDQQAARAFHDATKLSYINLLTKPPLYKSYPGLGQIRLPDAPPPEMPALEAVSGAGIATSGPLDLQAVAQVLHYSAGLIRRSVSASAGEVHYRAAASAGALYPIELYLVCGDLPGLTAGVYHYAPSDNALTQLRAGDFRGNLAAAADDDSMAAMPATIVSAAVFWRSAWKYRARGYRYCFWDIGTVLANLLATANALGQPAHLIAGFVDRDVDQVIGVDSEQEASTCLVPLGAAGGLRPYVARALSPIDSGNLGFNEAITYPESELLHVEARLDTPQQVSDWRGHVHRFDDIRTPSIASKPLGETIVERGSTRRFATDSISKEQLSELLAASSASITADFGSGLTHPYLIVNAVDGVQPGAYHYSRESGELELLKEGEFRAEAGHLCFEQALGADASAVIFFLADLDSALERLGNRGYRAAQLEAGLMGGNVYIAAHSLGLGATGMTFFDDAVTAFFSPHAAGKSLMFLVGLGRTGTPNRVRPFRSKYGVLKDSLARGASGERRPVPDWLYSN